MADRCTEVVRRALDDGVLTHTGRSVGDIASLRVAEEIVTALREAGCLLDTVKRNKRVVTSVHTDAELS